MRSSVVLGLLALGVLGARGAQAQCCPPRVAAERYWLPEETDGPPVSVHADDAGGVFILWSSAGGATLGISRDDGLGWEPLLTGVLDAGTRLAAAGEGRLVALAPGPSGGLRARISDDQGRSFTEPQEILSLPPDGELRAWRLDLASDGAVVALATVRRSAPEIAHEAWAVTSTDHGATWSAGTLLRSNRTAESVDDWGLALSETTALVVRAETGGVWAHRWTAAGGGWGEAVRVDAGEASVLTPRTVARSGGPGVFQVAFDTAGPTWRQHRVSVSTDDGRTWPGLETVVDEGADGEWDLVALGDGGVVLAGWDELAADPALMGSGSSDRGLPSTWPPAATAFAVDSVNPHHVRVAGGLSQAVVVHDDYRHDGPDCPSAEFECESIFLQRSCDHGASWDEFRLDTDDGTELVHSEDPELVFARSGRLHVVWSDGLEAPLTHHLAFDLPELPEPVLTATLEPGEGCRPARHEIEVEADSLDGCPGATFAWSEDGVPIPGAGGRSYRVPDEHPPGPVEVGVTVHCSGDPDCATASESIVVDVAPAPARPGVEVEELPGTSCLLPHHRLGVPDAEWEACGSPEVRWFADGAPLPGATGRELVVSAATIAPGLHSLRYELSCEPAVECGSSEEVELEVLPFDGRPPADVGPVLRALGHGEPRAPSVSATWSWSGDRGAPRGDEHYHLLRGRAPTRLDQPAAGHPLIGTTTAEETPAASVLPSVTFYRVLAADACERVSAD